MKKDSDGKVKKNSKIAVITLGLAGFSLLTIFLLRSNLSSFDKMLAIVNAVIILLSVVGYLFGKKKESDAKESEE